MSNICLQEVDRIKGNDETFTRVMSCAFKQVNSKFYVLEQ